MVREVNLECDEVLDDGEIQQGDVFAWENPAGQPYGRYGVIITADCDLALRKHRGVLSYLPILDMGEYTLKMWAPKTFSAPLETALNTLVIRINKQRAKLKPEIGEFSNEALFSWIDRSGISAVIETIGITDRGLIKQFEDMMEHLRKLQILVDGASADMELLKSCYMREYLKSSSDFHGALIKDVKKDISGLPGDIFFLSHIEKSEASGYFVLLRYVSQCTTETVGRSMIDMRNGAQARRIARIRAPYLYALTQQLGRVFSDIGLPDEYNTRMQASPNIFFAKSLEA